MSSKAARILQKEEKKIQADAAYKTSARILRQFASTYMLYEPPEISAGVWNQFLVRNILLSVQHRLAAKFGGEVRRMRDASALTIAQELGMNTLPSDEIKRRNFEDWAVVLAMIPNLERWSKTAKRQLLAMIRAKSGLDEIGYLRLMQNHLQLRDAIIKLGS